MGKMKKNTEEIDDKEEKKKVLKKNYTEEEKCLRERGKYSYSKTII